MPENYRYRWTLDDTRDDYLETVVASPDEYGCMNPRTKAPKSPRDIAATGPEAINAAVGAYGAWEHVQRPRGRPRKYADKVSRDRAYRLKRLALFGEPLWLKGLRDRGDGKLS
jgi:hypothetical protein